MGWLLAQHFKEARVTRLVMIVNVGVILPTMIVNVSVILPTRPLAETPEHHVAVQVSTGNVLLACTV